MKRRNFIAMIAAAPLCSTKAEEPQFYFPHWDEPFKSKPFNCVYFDEEVPEKMFLDKSVPCLSPNDPRILINPKTGMEFSWEEINEILEPMFDATRQPRSKE